MFAVVWLALPNVREVYINITNSQWHLGVLAFLVLLSRAPASRAGRAFDAVALAFSGVSGPFCMVLTPMSVWLAAVQRTRSTIVRAAILCAAAAVQAAVVFATVFERGAALLGAGPRMLARIVAQQVMVGALLGQYSMQWVVASRLWQSNVLPLGLATIGAVLTGVALWHGRQPLRLAVLAAGLLFAAALARPLITETGAQWPLMQIPGAGQRYYYYPMLAFLAVLFTLAGSRSRWQQLPGLGLLLLMTAGVWADWKLIPRQPTGFAEQAYAFEQAAPGTIWTYPFNPAFDRQPMRLVKR